MSTLSNVLLSKGAPTLDADLDSIFKLNPVKPIQKKSTPAPPPTAGKPLVPEKLKKRKLQDLPVEDNLPKKRRLSDGKLEKKALLASPAVAIPASKVKGGKAEKGKKEKKAKKGKEAPVEAAEVVPAVAEALDEEEVQEEDDDDDLNDEDADDDDEASGSDEENIIPVHESLLKTDAGPSKKRQRVDETQDERDARTVFVGNIAVNVVKTQSLKKQLIRHLTSFVPHSEVESVRFRSVAFKKPTSKLPDDPDKVETVSSKDLKSKERAAKWRNDASDPAAGKVYLSEAGKKKVAFIKGEFHGGIDTVNGYAVFAYPPEKADGADADTLSPAEVAKLVVERANGSTFLDKTLRLDHVGKSAAGWGTADPKLTVFVGNLDFATTEETLRAFFEALVATERGEPEEGVRWVKTVRVVRDKATQLGKGFAYVSFMDHECIDHVIAADADQLKFAKRILRVQRCKTAPSSKAGTSSRAAASPGKAPRPLPETGVKGKRPQPATARAVEIPRGDPKLGERLAGLDKDARKAAKSADQDRIARRLAKKKARAVMQKGAGALDLDRGKRERKRTQNPGKGSGTKPRMKNDRAIAKRNVKK